MTATNGPEPSRNLPVLEAGRDRVSPSGHAPIWGPAASLRIIAVCALVWVLREAAPVLLPVVLSLFLAYALDSPVDRLVRWRIPRLLASLAVVLGLVAALGSGARILWPQVETIVSRVPESAAQLRSALRRQRQNGEASTLDKVQAAARALDSAAAEAGRTLSPASGVTRVEVQQPLRVSDWLWTGSIGAVGLLSQAVVILALTLVLLVADDAFKRKLVSQMGTLGSKRVTVQILHDIERQIERFIWVQGLSSTVVGVATGLALWWVGVENPAAWGLFAGLFNVAPYFGPMIVTVALAAVALLQFGSLQMAALVAGLSLVITTLESLWLTPQLLGRTAALNSVAIFLALAFWTWVWGAPGLLLAIPILMAIKAVCDHVEGLSGVAAFLGR